MSASIQRLCSALRRSAGATVCWKVLRTRSYNVFQEAEEPARTYCPLTVNSFVYCILERLNGGKQIPCESVQFDINEQYALCSDKHVYCSLVKKKRTLEDLEVGIIKEVGKNK